MLTTIFVTRFNPSAEGHGGQHRAYQIVQDLQAGGSQIVVISAEQWDQSHPGRADAVGEIGKKFIRRLGYYSENLLKVWAFTPYSKKLISNSKFLQDYRTKILGMPHPCLCLIEHTGFADLIKINSQFGIPTWCCIQNLESVDMGVPLADFQRQGGVYARAIDLANELSVLASCSQRLFISKVETGFVGGLGLSADYYPYLPTGEIRRRLEKIRIARRTVARETGLFLVLGSASHLPTKEGFEWLLHQIQMSGLPAGIRVVFVGAGTEEFRPPSTLLNPVEFRGQLVQEELDQLMIHAEGMLVPQFRGFGALTRVSEAACAGIPTIISEHVALMLAVPPRVRIADTSWANWCRNMIDIQQIGDNDFNPDAYSSWEHAQPRLLANLIASQSS